MSPSLRLECLMNYIARLSSRDNATVFFDILSKMAPRSFLEQRNPIVRSSVTIRTKFVSFSRRLMSSQYTFERSERSFANVSCRFDKAKIETWEKWKKIKRTGRGEGGRGGKRITKGKLGNERERESLLYSGELNYRNDSPPYSLPPLFATLMKYNATAA